MEFDTRKSKIIIASVAGALLFAGLIFILSIYISGNKRIRYYFDIAFNLTKEHEAYVHGTKYTLPLPRGIAKMYRDSEFSVIYLTRLTFEDIISWYEENGYKVEGNCVYTNDLYYTIEDLGKDEEHPKRNIIRIMRHIQ